MKRTIFFLFASIVMLSVGHPAFGVEGPTPRPAEERLQVDKNGMVLPLSTSKKITFPNGVAVTAANIGTAKEIYIAYRTDSPACVVNVCGGGTKLDPYDGSTQTKLDSLWPEIESAAPKTVTFLPNTSAAPYITNTGLRMFSGVKIMGYGAYIKAGTGLATTVNNAHVFRRNSSPDGALNDCTVEGFNIDCNIANQTYANASVGAIKGFGARNKALHNNITNPGSKGTGAECMVIGYFTSNTIPGSDNEIAWNDTTGVTLTAGGLTVYSISASANSLTDTVNPDAAWQFGGRIHDNIIHDISVNGGVAGIGLGAWSVGQQIYRNTFRNLSGMAACLYNDTGASFDAKIFDNVGENVDVFIQIVPSSGLGDIQTNLKVTDNHASIKPGNPAYALNCFGGPFIRATIANNHFYRYGASGSCNLGVRLANSQQSIITGNSTDPYFNSTANRVDDYTDLTVSFNTFEQLQDLLGTNALRSASNHKNDGTRLVLATDTDIYQGGNASLDDVVVESVTGDGSGLSNVPVNASNITENTKTVNGGSYTVLSTDRVIDVDDRSSAQTLTFGTSASFYNKVFYVKDTSGQAQIRNIILSPSIEGNTITLNENYQGIKIRCLPTGVYSVVYRYTE